MERAWAARKKKPPQEYIDALEEEDDSPELDMLEAEYLRLFFLAQTCRPYTYGSPLPIPHTAVIEIAENEGLSFEETRTLSHVVQALDAIVLEDARNESQAHRPRSPSRKGKH